MGTIKETSLISGTLLFLSIEKSSAEYLIIDNKDIHKSLIEITDS